MTALLYITGWYLGHKLLTRAEVIYTNFPFVRWNAWKYIRPDLQVKDVAATVAWLLFWTAFCWRFLR